MALSPERCCQAGGSPLSPLREVTDMLEVRPIDEWFVIHDTVEDEDVMRFSTRTEAEALLTEIGLQESAAVHGLDAR
ncbi:hypothetical protein [Frateuria sp. Soil773]|uniref:hypothetical protein n=1 Tax=Frateuria sp. Soil773 TaxID=1736407 RepID=UPI0012FA64DA|nr:hypothetical protein [Frateuria sp. Soil773]